MKLPEIASSPDMLYKIMFTAVKSKLLITSIRLELYNYLNKSKTSEEIAAELESDHVNTEYMLNGLVACGLLEKKDGRYWNAAIAQDLLVKGKPAYLGEGFLIQSGMRDMMVSDMYKLVKDGSSGENYEVLDQSEEKWARFAKTMANNARSGIAQQMANIVSGLPEFSRLEKMIDLGGGPGIFGIYMVRLHPTMKGVVFDRKPSTEVAKKFIAEYNLEDRIDVLPGDYNKDSFGQGYDLVWASSTLNFAQPNLEEVIKKIYGSLNPGGLFINLSEGLTHESTKPEFFVMCTLGWSMHNHPLRAFEQGEIAEEMINAGFSSVRSRTIETGWGPMDLDIARKQEK